MITDKDPEGGERLSDDQRAYLRYKRAVGEHGKPFFPYGTWHDVVAATVVLLLIFALTWVWFAQANCDSVVNVFCDDAATPHMQEQYHPGEPQKLVEDETQAKEVGGPLLGPLYEDKADPATTSYHPRPEWYFYFLFELLIIFSHPQSVIFGTIIVPTIMLVLLLAWPFLDRKRERRMTRRPIAIAAMCVTAVTLLGLTYYGSKAGEETGPEGLTAEQAAMPGFGLVFEDPRSACLSCHTIAGSGNPGPGPILDDEASRNRDLVWQYQHLAVPQDLVPGSGMPPQKDIYSPEELAQIAAFVNTLGAPERATDPEYLNFKPPAEGESATKGGNEDADADTLKDPSGGEVAEKQETRTQTNDAGE